jgi:O-antigen ligase
LIAVHTIIQATSGITLFGSSNADAYLTSVSNYRLAPGINVNRLGSFFIDPNWDGTFLAMMLFLPLGLFVESNTFLEKVLCFAEVLIILPALLFTYSAGAWVSVCGGMLVFIALVGRSRFHVQLILPISVALIMIIAWFPEQIALQVQHALRPDELPLRLGAWQTGLNLIFAYPLTGVGLSQLAYLEYSKLYQAPLQSVPLEHPHNSYLEWGAMAGLPVLLVFLALLSFALWQALRNWVRADAAARSLLGAGIAAIASLTINSWSIDAWTLAPLAATGWLILGVVSSPLLTRNRNGQEEQQKNNTVLHA